MGNEEEGLNDVREAEMITVSQESSPRIRVYHKNAKGPYFVYIRQRVGGQAIHSVIVSKLLTRKYKSIVALKVVVKEKMRVEFTDLNEANKLPFDNDFAKDYHVYIQASCVEIQGVIPFSIHEDLKDIKESAVGRIKAKMTESIDIVEVKRLHKYVKTNVEEKAVPINFVRITFAGHILPEIVEINKLLIPKTKDVGTAGIYMDLKIIVGLTRLFVPISRKNERAFKQHRMSYADTVKGSKPAETNGEKSGTQPNNIYTLLEIEDGELMETDEEIEPAFENHRLTKRRRSPVDEDQAFWDSLPGTSRDNEKSRAVLKDEEKNIRGKKLKFDGGGFKLGESVSISLQIGNSSNHRVSLDCLVMKKITNDQPSRPIDAKSVPIPPQFTLADPDWNKRQSIDLLIGGQYFWQFIQEGSHSIGKDAPLLKQSVFGWLVVGPCNIESHSNSPRNLMCHVSTLASIESAIKKFWEIEEIDRPKDQVAEYKEVEDQFASTSTRNTEGRYIVELPFNDKVNELGNNQAAATKQLFYLERRLNKNSDLKQEYSNVFNEYLSLNIIEAVPFNEMGLASYYLPHHCVIREQSTSTKVRIVFNASSKSQSGLSLNDCLKVGPVVQPTLVSVLLRFRQHKFALTCDIVKMYLQVLLEPKHRDYQRFVWRENADDPVKAFRFRTVCFGVAPSPFLATRVLNQLVADEGEDFPLASRAILSNFYVDDCLMSSVTSVEELLELKGQLISLLNRAGMQLSKFKSNCPYAIEDKPATQQTLHFEDETVKTLGMIWNPNSDTFQYIVQEIIEDQPVTKRLILSTIARIFDPIGLISPLITKAKLIFQSTWEVSTTWDQPVPDDLSMEWKIFVEDLPLIQYLRIPRWVSSIENPSSNELHAFCDASFVAYGAAIYLVCEDANGQRSSRLLTAKSKITPLKNKVSQSLTIPKAELCGAVMATELMKVVSQSLQISDHFFWTDATIILHQIHSPHERRELFVKRPAAKILSVSNPQQWRHVPTLENPADILSRGALPGKLKNSVLWWQGPQFIRKEPQHWPPPFDASSQFPIVDEQVTLINVPAESSDSNPIYSYLTTNIGSYNRIRRVLAWCFRTVNVFKLKLKRCTRQTAAQSTSEFLKTHELREADKFLVRWDQQEHFDQILVTIKTKNFNTSQRFAAIRKLRPFLDSDNILRVGGRLQKSGEPYDVRHPKLLAEKSILARLIATHTHLSLLHAGPQLILAQLRQAYWPMDGRNLCRSITHNCIKCIKANPPQQEQLMGELPEHRMTAIKAFQATGVDFAGPLLLKSVNRKGSPIKAYVAVFVCMGTKALHLELVSTLETDAFIATLRRFVARRGLPTHMYSDQGTTFIGADNELKRMFQQTKSQEIFANFLSERNTQWCFQPPKAPHHGGLWEAAVKSCKFHLKRILGQTPLTFEEMQTTLSEIEAVLNSRPLVPISTHPDDPSCLTPGHFLTDLIDGNYARKFAKTSHQGGRENISTLFKCAVSGQNPKII
ncbi:uncharacterized protein LOC129808940 [Phlebotomus papatasi]|uniref:uncharacterized protein LOC129808940 n=1 Tax=Phlebotomus papatasi TaxID=29031 RepID=UPI00248378CC|nr:uncharacterized protein LOC129808940 [Phlebotomus papatasi]